MKINALVLADILVISGFICTVGRYVYGFVRMRSSGEKFFRAKKNKSKTFSIFWIVICLFNILISGWSIADYIRSGNARDHVADIVNKSCSVTVFLAILISVIMDLFVHVYISEKYVVTAGNFYSSDNVLFWVKPEPEKETSEKKQINLYYRNTRLPFCSIPYNENTPEEEFYKVLKTYKYRDLPEPKRRISHPFLLSCIIVFVLLTAVTYTYFRTAGSWIRI